MTSIHVSSKYLYLEGCYVLYASDRESSLFYHVLCHSVMFAHQSVVQGRVPLKRYRLSNMVLLRKQIKGKETGKTFASIVCQTGEANMIVKVAQLTQKAVVVLIVIHISMALHLPHKQATRHCCSWRDAS